LFIHPRDRQGLRRRRTDQLTSAAPDAPPHIHRSGRAVFPQPDRSDRTGGGALAARKTFLKHETMPGIEPRRGDARTLFFRQRQRRDRSGGTDPTAPIAVKAALPPVEIQRDRTGRPPPGRNDQLFRTISRAQLTTGAFGRKTVDASGAPSPSARLAAAGVYVNGEKLTEEYLHEPMLYTGDMHFTVPEGSYFLLGDNRNQSLDARYWNNHYIEKSKIIAKVYFRYFPVPKLIK